MGVTIKDIAREADVSVATVSRALNNSDSVTVETRDNIRAIAQRLRYVPHGAARSLITRRTQTLGVVLPDLHGEFFSELIRGIDAAAREHGLHLLVSSSHGSAQESADALRALSGRVDGILMMSPHADLRSLSAALPATTPCIVMNTRAESVGGTALSIDNHGGARSMIDHLVDCGYRRIAMIAGPADNFDAQERLRGYRDAVAARLPGTALDVTEGDFSEAAGAAAGRRIAAMGISSRPDAVFAANDMMALGCLTALKDAGIDVPGDIAICGFDDIPIARYVTPALTTMRVHIFELGNRAADALIARINGQDDPVASPIIAPELVVRTSTRPPTPHEDSS